MLESKTTQLLMNARTMLLDAINPSVKLPENLPRKLAEEIVAYVVSQGTKATKTTI